MRGERGPRGPQGPPGQLSNEQLDEIVEMQRRMDVAQKELHLQFQRIAQMQAQLDKLLSMLAPDKRKG